MDTVLNSIIILFWSAFFLATVVGLYYSFRHARTEAAALQDAEASAESVA